jgi:glycosyltransferase involved in cell wall biosynthesis
MIEAMSCGCYVISTNIGALKEIANPYGEFLDIDINKSPSHPYYESIDANYISNIVEKSVNIIEQYLNNSEKLELRLQQQIEFIKKKYNWKNQADYLYNLNIN